MVDSLVKKQVIQPLRKFIEKFISHEKNTSEVTVTSSGELFHIKGFDSIASLSEGTLAQNVRSWDYKVTFKSCPSKLSLTELLLHKEYIQAKEVLKTDRSLIDSVLFEACFANNFELVQIIIDLKKLQDFAADVNIKNSYGKGLLHISAAEGYFEMTNALIETRPDIDLNLLDNDLKTPLHLACQNKQAKISQILLSHQINLDQEDIFGNTALHYAFISNNSQIIEQLLEKGANKLKKNIKGELPEDLNFNFNFYNAGSGVSDDCYIVKDHDEAKYSSMIEEINNFFFKPYSGLSLSPHDFIPLKVLGKGSFGQVFLVKKRDTQEKFAMKILAKNKVIAEELVKYALTERNVMTIVKHTFIVSLWYAFQTQSKLYLILDYCPGGTLKNVLMSRGSLDESLARVYLSEIVLALEELHRNGVIYRDLKPENVAIASDGHIKLIDFGLSKDQAGNNSSFSFCGSVSYLAPEMLRRTGHGKAVDWYLLGIVLFEMLTGRVPFFAMNNEKMFRKILKCQLQVPRNCSENCQSLLRALITKFPEDRLGSNGGAEEVKSHKFFEGVVWDDVVEKKGEVIPSRSVNENIELPEDAILDKSEESLPSIQGWTFVHSEAPR